MADTDVFLDRLTDALRSYAADGAMDVEPMELARSISLAHPHRSGGWGWVGATRGRRSIIVLALLVALLVASAVGTLTVGRFIRSDDPIVQVDGAHPIPLELYGEWQFNRGGGDTNIPPNALMIDPTGPVFVRLPGGTPADWAGRAVAFLPTRPGQGELLIRAIGACGEGRYLVRNLGGAGRIPWIFVDLIDDACPERAALLASPMGWVRPREVPLVAGQTYGSWAFTEPFHFTAQAFEFSEGTSTGVAQQYFARGGLKMRSGYFGWSVYVIDDLPLRADACDPSKGELADVPPTPEAVGEWLRSSRGLTVAAAVPIPVGGRTALRFDLVSQYGEHASGGCTSVAAFEPPNIKIGPTVYAIPTGDDTILVAVTGDPSEFAVVDRAVEALVRSITFD